MASPRVWFITGTSSGFGRAVTEHVLKSGDIVVATLRNPSALSDLSATYPASKLLVVQLDVTDAPEIVRAFAKATETFGHIDVVFNNAGYGLNSVAEGAPEEAVRKQFEVNFWGAANVTREAIRVFRDVNSPPGGRLIQNSGSCYFYGVPTLSYYAATKTALEGFTTSLLEELDPAWNIKATLIEPSGFRTDTLERSMTFIPPPPAYSKPDSIVTKIRQWLENDPKLPGDPKKAAEVIYKLAGLTEVPLHLPLGKEAVAKAKEFVAKLAKEVEQFESFADGTEADD